MYALKDRRLPWFFIGILVFSALLRIVWLDRVPVGLSNDEVDYILNAKAVFLTGSDISGTWNPLSLTSPLSSFPKAELPSVLTFPIVGILPLSLGSSKLIYAFFSILTVFVLYLMVKKLLGDKAALITALVAGINPWFLFFGRTAYDTPIAILFYLLGMYMLLIGKKWFILLAFPCFFFGFYSYIGTKLILIPLVGIASGFAYFINGKKYLKQYITVCFLCTALVGLYVFQIRSLERSRIGELAYPGMPEIAGIVDIQRRLSIQTPFTNVFTNKYTVFAKYAMEKYMNAFSPEFLFLHGDSKALFTVRDHGVFYVTDAVFILIGLYFLFLRKKKVGLFLLSLLLIAPLPSVASNSGISYAIRAYLLAPVLIICAGYGIYSAIFFRTDKSYRFIAVLGITVLYVIQLANFLHIYFFRNPVYNAESFNLSSRILVKYLSVQPAGRDTYVVNGDPSMPLKHYLFYENAYHKGNSSEIIRMYAAREFYVKNIHFITCEDVQNVPSGSSLVYESGTTCPNIPQGAHSLSIVQPGDSGGVYTILNDSVCSTYNLKRYMSGMSFSDLNVEKLSEKRFCETYIIDYSR